MEEIEKSYIAERGKMIREKPTYDYSNLRWNNVTPTDIDGACEFAGKYWVVLEGKREGANMDKVKGQTMFFRRTLKALCESGKRNTLFILFQHNDMTPTNEKSHILIQHCKPIEVLFNEYKQDISAIPTTVKEIIDFYGRQSAERFYPELEAFWPS